MLWAFVRGEAPARARLLVFKDGEVDGGGRGTEGRALSSDSRLYLEFINSSTIDASLRSSQ